MTEEKTVYKGNPSILTNFGTFFFCALIFVAVLIAIFSFWAKFSTSPVRFALLGLLVVPVLIAFSKWLVLKSHLYEITTERIKLTRGILSKKTDEMELYRVKDTTLVEPFLLRMFSAGDIHLSSADSSTPILKLEGIRGAKEVREELRKNIEACRERKGTRTMELE